MPDARRSVPSHQPTGNRAAAFADPREWAVLLLIAAVTCVAYLPALGGGMLWDDDAHVTKPELRGVDGLGRIWFEPGATQQFYPLLHTAFWIQYQLWGEHTAEYHLVNLLLHLAAAGLVYAIVRKLEIPGAALAALIFALHPVQVETVAWITEQKNTLSAVFYLGAMLAYLHFDQTRQPKWYAVALGLFVAGLLSKTVVATLPGALLVIFWWQRGKLSWRQDVVPLLPFFVLGAGAGLVTVWVERNLIGAKGTAFELSFVQRCLLAGRVIWFYLGALIWPSQLTFIYPRWQINPANLRQWIFPAAAIAVLVGAWAIRARSRAPLAAALFFVGTLFPVLGFFDVYPFRFSFVADHFQYLASLGVIVPAAAAIALLAARLSRSAHWLAPAAALLLVWTLAALTWNQSLLYRDAITLYQATIARNPGGWLAYNNLGALFVEAGRLPEAIRHFERALELNPEDVESQNGLGGALLLADRPQEALGHFEVIARQKPNSSRAHKNVGDALAAMNQPVRAIESFQRGLQLRPDDAEIHCNLAGVLASAGQPQEALAHSEYALQLRPGYAEAHCNRGIALRSINRNQEAIESFERALALKPAFAIAQYNLGNTLLHLHRTDDAIEHFERALRLKPAYPEAANNLGVALLNAGRAQEAVERLQQTVRLSPEAADAWANLAEAHARLGQIREALAAAQKALELARAQGDAELIAQVEAAARSYRSRAGAQSSPAPTPP